VSDNGVQFKANEIEALFSKLGNRHVYYNTALYSPQSNAAERVNCSLLSAIRSYISKDQTKCDLHLPSISSGLRSALHQSVGCSPYKALFGMKIINLGTINY